MHLDNGKFSEGWVLDDNLGRYQQLGALPPTEEILGSERRITMYARLTLGQVQQGKMDEAIQKYNDINIAEIKSHQGFQKAYLLVNREESKVIALSFWDSEEDALAREATDEYRQAHAYLPDLAAAPPVREGYEIAVES
jgi:heme-degrading monooxygenase HmoA